MAENPTFFVGVLCEVFPPAYRDKEQAPQPSPEARARGQMFVRRYFGRHHIPSYFGRLCYFTYPSRKRPELPVASKSPAMHSAQADQRATFHFWVKKVNSTLPFAPIMQRNRFGLSDFVLSRYASPMIIVFTFVSSIWVVSYLTQQALGPALRRRNSLGLETTNGT